MIPRSIRLGLLVALSAAAGVVLSALTTGWLGTAVGAQLGAALYTRVVGQSPPRSPWVIALCTALVYVAGAEWFSSKLSTPLVAPILLSFVAALALGTVIGGGAARARDALLYATCAIVILADTAIPWTPARARSIPPLANRDVPLPPVRLLAFHNAQGVPEIMRELPDAFTKVDLPDTVTDKLCYTDGTRLEKGWPIMPAGPARPVVLNGTGSLHHMTYYVLRQYIEPLGIPYTLLQIDAHDDCRKPKGPHIDCGSWVTWASRHGKSLARVVHIGGSPKRRYNDYTPWYCEALREHGTIDRYVYDPREEYFSRGIALGTTDLAAVRHDLLGTIFGRSALRVRYLEPEDGLKLIGERIPTRHLFVSVDLDVLSEDEISTEWSNGKMSIEDLEETIERATRGRVLLGADVCGISPTALEDGHSVKTVARVYGFLRRLVTRGDGGIPREKPASGGARSGGRGLPAPHPRQ